MNRTTLALALFVLPALTTAQTTSVKPATAASSKDTILFDFDSGSYDGWTLSGDCWNTQPAARETSVDKARRSVASGVV